MLKRKSADNFKVAQWAINKPFFDVAMSRMYYAVFEIVKYYLFKDRTFFNNLGIKEYELRHINMPTFLNQYLSYKKVALNRINIISISKIAQMSKNRQKADYCHVGCISESLAREYINYAEDIIKFMNKIHMESKA